MLGRGRESAGDDDDALQRLFLYSRADTIYGGSNEIQRNVIGERALGLPKEPKMTTVTDAARRTPTGRGLLEGKTVLVTAAAGTGIGFATAKRCVEEGARVAITDIHERRLRESADASSACTRVARQRDVASRRATRCFDDVDRRVRRTSTCS